MSNPIKVEVVEMIFQKDITVLQCKDGDQYEVTPTMKTGEKMCLEFFHNEVFHTSRDRLFGIEGDRAMRN